jgi:hypothetical protein
MERIKKYAYTLPFVHTCFVVGTLPSISLSPRAHGLFLRLRWRWPSSELQPSSSRPPRQASRLTPIFGWFFTMHGQRRAGCVALPTQLNQRYQQLRARPWRAPDQGPNGVNEAEGAAMAGLQIDDPMESTELRARPWRASRSTTVRDGRGSQVRVQRRSPVHSDLASDPHLLPRSGRDFRHQRPASLSAGYGFEPAGRVGAQDLGPSGRRAWPALF